MKKTLFSVLMVVISSCKVFAQSLPVDAYNLQDLYRVKQLSGEVDSNISFAVRPLVLSSEKFNILYGTGDSLKNRLNSPSDGWKALPFTWQNQFNTHHPTGWNDGSIFPAKGIQTFLSGGFYGYYKGFSFQFKPELILTANPKNFLRIIIR